MKISIITVVYNGENYLESCIQSVLSQNYPEIEYIIVDGASTDQTPEIINRDRDQIDILITEPDKGIYDAMNKGVKVATGDVVGLLNADDLYERERLISRIAAEFRKQEIDSVFGDLIFVHPDNLNKIVRYYQPRKFKLNYFRRGDMPPHPTFFVKRELYDRFGCFNTSFQIAADFELMVRFLLKGGASFAYIPETLVRMRTGGVSTSGIQSTFKVNREIKRALEINNISTSMLTIYSKYFTKIFQLIKKPD